MLLQTDIPNKPKLWRKVCHQVQEDHYELGFLLQDKAYLDSLERGLAVVGVKSYPILEMLERKRAIPILEQILTDLTGKPVQVKLAHGRPRLYEQKAPPRIKPHLRACGKCQKKPNDCLCEYGPWPQEQTEPSSLQATPGIQWKNEDLGTLHARYGDIMGIVDNHPVFVQACKPLTEGGWGIFNKELTNACKDYGADIVLKGLRDVANRPSVDRPRSYFFKNLRTGVYGHKLAVPASPIGPVGE